MDGLDPMTGRQIMTADEIGRRRSGSPTRSSRSRPAPPGLTLVGMQRRGVPLAPRIAAAIEEHEGATIPVGALDITFYRDDLSLVAEQPIVKGTDLRFDLNGATVVLVDDVLYTGRTIRAALDALVDFGRPGPSAWPSSSTAATASCRSAPTTSARTCRPRARSWSRSTSRRPTAQTGSHRADRRGGPGAGGRMSLRPRSGADLPAVDRLRSAAASRSAGDIVISSTSTS